MASHTTRASSPPAARSRATGVKRASISMIQLSMLTVVAVASLRSLPTAATYGLGSIALYIIPAIVFLIPTALVAAELATGWKGGVYVWVREAFGNRWGFVAIWLQWIQNVVWFPVQLAFVAATIGFIFGKADWGNSGAYTAIAILVLYWVSTIITLAGNNLFARIGSLGGWIGTILSGVVLIVLSLIWIFSGEPSQAKLSWDALNPMVDQPATGTGFLAAIAPLVLVVSNFLGFAGMEVNAVHVNEMKNPKRDYPKAILIAAILILVVFIIPTLGIAFVVSSKDLGLTTGLMVAFKTYFSRFHMGWATNIMALLIVLGAIASVITWIAGPSKGLLLASRTGLLPKGLQTRNKNGIQLGILILQGVVVSVMACLFFFLKNVSTAFFTLVDMAAALYLIMYMFMFAAVMVLRKPSWRTEPTTDVAKNTP